MGLTELGVQHLRIIEAAQLNPCPSLNVISGKNGSGKTSLLEAIHILSSGRSFRSPIIEPVIQQGAAWLRVTGTVKTQGLAHRLGIERGRDRVKIRLDGREERSMAALAQLLPVVALHPESHGLIAGPPALRRAFLDWGAFQTVEGFHGAWKRFQRLLQQRNHALRQGAPAAMLRALERELVPCAETMDRARERWVGDLQRELQTLGEVIRGGGDVGLRYRRGWPDGRELGQVLEEAEARDRSQGFTHAGPHRAELVVTLAGEPAAKRASRGQEKLLAVLLKLAQARIFRRDTGLSPVVIIDDLPSELDAEHRQRLLEELRSLQAQVFVTSIEADEIPQEGWGEARMFHVEQGRVRELV